MVMAQLKKVLEGQEAELQKRIHSINRDLQQTHSQDFAEQAAERENDEVLQALKAEAEVELQHIHKALQRIDTGDYGICIECGAAIAEARLRALPQATTCIQCAH